MIFCGAFSKNVRHEIKWRSEGRSELSGTNGERMVCAHLNHNKKCEKYNRADEGLYVTIFEELAYHLLHSEEPDKIGLQKDVNDSVIRGHLGELLRKHSTDEIREKTGEAIGLWEEYLQEKKKQDIYPRVHFEGFED